MSGNAENIDYILDEVNKLVHDDISVDRCRDGIGLHDGKNGCYFPINETTQIQYSSGNLRLKTQSKPEMACTLTIMRSGFKISSRVCENNIGTHFVGFSEDPSMGGAYTPTPQLATDIYTRQTSLGITIRNDQ